MGERVGPEPSPETSPAWQALLAPTVLPRKTPTKSGMICRVARTTYLILSSLRDAARPKTVPYLAWRRATPEV